MFGNRIAAVLACGNELRGRNVATGDLYIGKCRAFIRERSCGEVLSVHRLCGGRAAAQYVYEGARQNN
jgi:hypothetical protein